VASTAITTAECPTSCNLTMRSSQAMPSRETGIDTGSTSDPVPSLSHTRFITLPGSTATTNVDVQSLKQRHDQASFIEDPTLNTGAGRPSLDSP
jgi:hypothetical protein